MKVIKVLFLIGVLMLGGLLALGYVLSIVLEPSAEEVAKREEQKREDEQKKKQAERERLQSDFNGRRLEVISEVNDLIKGKNYGNALGVASRFLEAGVSDEELERLADAARKKAEDERKAAKEAEERRITAALQKMRKTADRVEGIDWYRDRSSPSYTNQNAFYVYIGKREGAKPWMRLRIQYFSDEWLFINSFVVVADGQRFEKSAARFKRDNDHRVWEWYDENLSDSDLVMIRAVVNSRNSIIRFNGENYYEDKQITSAQKAALRNVLDAYAALDKG